MSIKTLPNGDTEGFSTFTTSMVPEQPEALRLADWLERRTMKMLQDRQAAAELRRLYAENEALRGMSFDTKRDMETEALLRQALAVIDSMEQNHGNLWQVPYEPEQLEAIATALRERLK